MPVPATPPADQDRRPDHLHLVTDSDLDAAAAQAVAAGVEPLAPWQTRVTDTVAGVVRGLPAAVSQRPMSVAERIDHSRTGDWVTSDEDWKRTLHMLGTLVTLPAGLLGSLLLWVSARPERLLILLVLFVIVSHI